MAWPKSLSARIEALDDIQAHDMLPPPAEQQQLLLKLLESMPSAEYEMFLGEKLHPLVQAPYPSIYLLPPTPPQENQTAEGRLRHRHRRSNPWSNRARYLAHTEGLAAPLGGASSYTLGSFAAKAHCQI